MRTIFVTNRVVEDAQTAKLLADLQMTPVLQDVSLRGIARDIPVYAIGCLKISVVAAACWIMAR